MSTDCRNGAGPDDDGPAIPEDNVLLGLELNLGYVTYATFADLG